MSQITSIARAGSPVPEQPFQSHQDRLQQLSQRSGARTQQELVEQREREMGRTPPEGIDHTVLPPDGPIRCILDSDNENYYHVVLGCLEQQLKSVRHPVRLEIYKDKRLSGEDFRKKYTEVEKAKVGRAVTESHFHLAQRITDYLTRGSVVGVDADAEGNIYVYHGLRDMPELPQVEVEVEVEVADKSDKKRDKDEQSGTKLTPNAERKKAAQKQKDMEAALQEAERKASESDAAEEAATETVIEKRLVPGTPEVFARLYFRPVN